VEGVSDADSQAYWAGWYDSMVTYGWDYLEFVMTCEGLDWYMQDVTMLAALNG
jgi:hypothetical protein